MCSRFEAGYSRLIHKTRQSKDLRDLDVKTALAMMCIGFLVVREYADSGVEYAFLIPQMGWSIDVVLAHIRIILR